MEQISPLDARILRFVLENGLLESEREIAKKLKISPSTLSFKLRKFEDRGIITAYKYRIDYTKIGLKQIAWALLKMQYGKTSVKEIMERLLEFPQVHVCLFVSGENNICIKIYGKDKTEIKSFIEHMEKDLRGTIECSKILFVSGQIKGHNQQLNAKARAMQLDETDFNILAEKMTSPELSLNSLARKLTLHRNTVNNRWAKLIEEKVIVKKTPIINPQLHRQIGIHTMAVNLFRAGQFKIKVAQELSKLNEIHELNMLESGCGYDLLAIVRTNDLDSYYKIVGMFFSEKSIAENIEGSDSFMIIASDSRRHTYLKDIGLKNILGKSD